MYQCILSLDIFISFSEVSVLITCRPMGFSAHHTHDTLFWGFSTHLDETVLPQAVAVKAVTPGGDY